MGRQSDIFAKGEGQQWLSRNIDKLPVKDDPVLAAIKAVNIKPQFVLEIGCANGWRLIELRNRYNCVCDGVDPAIERPIHAADFVWLHPGTADNLEYHPIGKYDLVIYGFCLYLCDPEDYFKIVMEGDRVLADGGHLVIYDFTLDAFIYPHARKYAHKEGLLSHKMRFENLWKGHPAYTTIWKQFMGKDRDMTSVVILKKDMRSAFPVEEE